MDMMDRRNLVESALREAARRLRRRELVNGYYHQGSFQVVAFS